MYLKYPHIKYLHSLPFIKTLLERIRKIKAASWSKIRKLCSLQCCFLQGRKYQFWEGAAVTRGIHATPGPAEERCTTRQGTSRGRVSHNRHPSDEQWFDMASKVAKRTDRLPRAEVRENDSFLPMSGACLSLEIRPSGEYSRVFLPRATFLLLVGPFASIHFPPSCTGSMWQGMRQEGNVVVALVD